MIPLNFDMDALRTMVVGVELGGFAHAAVRLNRSPSAVSMQLRKLETQSGQRLFKRNGRGLILTEAGEVLLQYARRVLALNDEMGVAVGAVTRGGTVRVGMPQDITELILPSLLQCYSNARPTAHVEVKGGRNHTFAEDIANGRLDVALAFTAAGKGGENTIVTVPTVWIGKARSTRYGLRSGADDRRTAEGIPRSASGATRDDRVVPLVVFDGPCLFREMGIDALSQAGLPWRLAMTTPSLATLCCGLRAGLGVAVRTAAAASSKGLGVVPAAAGLPALPPIDIVLYCAAELSPAAQSFRDLLVETVRRECWIGARARPNPTHSKPNRARDVMRAPS